MIYEAIRGSSYSGVSIREIIEQLKTTLDIEPSIDTVRENLKKLRQDERIKTNGLFSDKLRYLVMN